MRVSQPKPEHLFFSYGSNMNQEQIRSRCTSAKVLAIARLADYRLSFFGHSKVWDGAMESIVPSAGHHVWGVVYKLTALDGDLLDTWQDARLDGSGTYFHSPHQVTDSEGNLHKVFLFKKDILGEPSMPSREYLDFIILGALQNGIPLEYIEELRLIESRNAEYEVPRRGKYGRGFLAASGCSGCDM